MGKIALLSPNIKSTANSINRVQPGHGIGLLAGVLKKQGHEVYIRDTAMEGYNNRESTNDGKILIGETEEQIRDYISKIDPEIVGISVVFSNLIDHAHKIAKITKEINPKIKIVIGGNHITNAVSDYEYACSNKNSNLQKRLVDLEDTNIDFGMVGECDYVFSELVDALLTNKNPYEIDGLIYRDNGGYVINPRPGPIPLNTLPFEARDQMNMEGYFDVGLFHSPKSKSKRVLSIMASRGCPEQCSFCTTPNIWGRKIRWKQPQRIYEEIVEGIKKYQIEEVQFSDDTLTANKKNVEELCDLIKPLNLSWCTPNGIKINYQQGEEQHELFKKMKESGCYQVSFGCESGVQRVLDSIHKNLKLEQINPAIENAKRAGLRVHTFWIVGFPGETREEMERTIEFAAQTNADTYSVSIYTPLPGTPIYREVCKKNLWWNKNEKRDRIYTNSLIKVDGFNNATEFEEWVDKQNIYLNRLLKGTNPKLFEEIYKSDAALFLKKQI